MDIGTSTLKLVELANEGGRPKLLTYGYMEQANDVIRSDSDEAKGRMIKSLKVLVEKSHAQSRDVIAALPSYTVFSSIIHLPVISKREELASAVQWEAKKFVPMPIEDMILDWKVLNNKPASPPAEIKITEQPVAVPSADPMASQPPLPTPAKPATDSENKENGATQRILITAAPKNLVDRYIALFKAAGLHLLSLETESLALERALVGKDPSPILIMDFGASATTLLVVANAVPIINRSIDVGGANMTGGIAESLGISVDRAEQLKRDVGVKVEGGADDMVYPAKLEAMVNALLNEVRYVLNLYHNQSDVPIEKIILTGGSAFLANLPELLTQRFNIKTFIGDPWARVIAPADLTEVLKEIGPSMSISIGLAMREIL